MAVGDQPRLTFVGETLHYGSDAGRAAAHGCIPRAAPFARGSIPPGTVSVSGDIRIAFRSLRKNPSFLALAVLILGLGVGANTAVFSLFEALVLRSLPVEKPGELAVLGPGALGTMSRSDFPQDSVFSFSQYQALKRDNNDVLATVAAVPTFPTGVYWGDEAASGDRSQRASCTLVTGSYFPLLHVRPYRGRLLEPGDETAPEANPVAVVSHAFWTSRLGSAADTVGSTIRLQGTPYTIVGIAGPSFRGHVNDSRTDIWVPISMQASLTRSPSRLEPTTPWETYWLNILMRLKPGVTFERAEVAINARMQEIFLQQAGPGIADDRREDLEQIRISLTPMGRGLSRLRTLAQRPLILLWAATALVLLIACGNLGILLLARAAERQQEFGVRRALGARRLNLLRPLLAESAVLAVAGTLVGYGLAHWLLPIMQQSFEAIRGSQTLEARLAWPELLFASGIGTLTIFLFGLVPAARATQGAMADTLRSGGAWATSGRGTARVRGLLVAGQCALALVLLATAGLFLRTLSELRGADLGIDAANVIGISIDPRSGGFRPESQPSMRRRILERVETLPGVQAAAFTGSLPLERNITMRTVSVSGYTPAEDEDMNIIHVWASPNYFDALGIQLLRGRVPGYGDPDQVVVNRAFAARFFPDGSVLEGVLEGKIRIVGVVADVRQVSPRDDPPPLVYQSTGDYNGFVETLAVRTSGTGETTATAIREAVREIVPGLPIERGYQTVASFLEQTVALELMLARLVGAFAVVALMLAALGMFAILSHMVRSRMTEIGVRMAFGSTGTRASTLILRSAAIPLAYGAVVGLAGVIGAGRLVSGVLYEVRPFEWEVAAWAAVALTLFAFLASILPAIRASRVGPAEALRHD